MNTTQNAIDASFSQNYFVKLGQLLAVLTVAQKNETRRSMKSHTQNAVRDEILKKSWCTGSVNGDGLGNEVPGEKIFWKSKRLVRAKGQLCLYAKW